MDLKLSEEEMRILEDALVDEITNLCKKRVVFDVGTDERERLEKRISNAKSILKAVTDYKH